MKASKVAWVSSTTERMRRASVAWKAVRWRALAGTARKGKCSGVWCYWGGGVWVKERGGLGVCVWGGGVWVKGGGVGMVCFLGGGWGGGGMRKGRVWCWGFGVGYLVLDPPPTCGDRQTGRQAGRQADRQKTGRPAGRPADRQTDRHPPTHL